MGRARPKTELTDSGISRLSPGVVESPPSVGETSSPLLASPFLVPFWFHRDCRGSSPSARGEFPPTYISFHFRAGVGVGVGVGTGCWDK